MFLLQLYDKLKINQSINYGEIKMKKLLVLLLLMLVPASQCFAQATSPVCTSEDHDDLDFWVGKWNAVWDGGSGTNEITKEYSGCVIREDFKGSNLLGMSVSTYFPGDKSWHQTWMDEQNGYLNLDGYYDGADYIFHTTPDANNPDIQLQMVFSDIKKDSFTWTWMRTTDGGKNWQNNWQISYTRVK
tara:strand:- start:18106 stop:18666 length:561 start_codon:yes stop_codon:yes gene_type:complete